jgi:hypothetical protein
MDLVRVYLNAARQVFPNHFPALASASVSALTKSAGPVMPPKGADRPKSLSKTFILGLSFRILSALTIRQRQMPMDSPRV